MYFVPLISPVTVDRGTSNDNHQQVSVISYEKKVASKSFHVDCEFEIKGSGFSRYTFDPTGIIALKIAESKKSATRTRCRTCSTTSISRAKVSAIIQIKGAINGSIQTVTEVNLEFNARGHRSPVLIGLYDVKAKSGQYSYEQPIG